MERDSEIRKFGRSRNRSKHGDAIAGWTRSELGIRRRISLDRGASAKAEKVYGAGGIRRLNGAWGNSRTDQSRNQGAGSVLGCGIRLCGAFGDVLAVAN